MELVQPIARFSSRVGHYTKYRPEYPAAILNYLEQSIFLSETFKIADIGAGTGNFTKLLLDKQYGVTAIEPNEDMRNVATKRFAAVPNYSSLAASAENTTLPDNSIDLITCAQSFHWFDPLLAVTEFERIIKPSGHILLLWNILSPESPFMNNYITLKDRYSESVRLPFTASLANLRSLFDPAPVIENSFSYSQCLDREGIKGHLLSHSRIPMTGSEAHDRMMYELDDLFDFYEENDCVTVHYVTKVYLIPSLKL